MFHVEKLSREAPPKEKIVVDERNVKAVYEKLSDPVERVDSVYIGCPHLSAEVRIKSKMVSFDRLKIFDTVARSCPVVSELGERSIATNSAKMAYYLKNVLGKEVLFTTIENCLRLARKPRCRGKPTKPEGIKEEIKGRVKTVAIKSKPYICLKHGVEYVRGVKAGTESTAFGDVAYCGDGENFILKLPDPSFIRS